MKRAEEIKKILVENRSTLAKEYGIRQIGLFGSVVRSEQRRGSDIDILVDFTRTPGLFAFVRLKNDLSTLLGCPVDLVMKSAMKPRLGRRILSEVLYV